jgi:hypothetical protein
MRLPRVDTVSCMTAKFEPTGGCYCGEIYHEYGMDDCIFRNIVRPAFARAVCAALALSPLKLTEDKALAFAMSQHARLGEQSFAQGLPSEIMSRIILKIENFERCA